MKICIAGWYLEKQFLDSCYRVRNRYESFVVSHKKAHRKDFRGINYRIIPNIGLEFGCYDYYLKNIWDGKSDVFFTHDDTVVGGKVFDEIAKIRHDCAYVFRDEAEERSNGGKHGRAIFCSARFLKLILNYECNCHQAKDREDRHHHEGAILKGTGPHKGFWYDPENKGFVSGRPDYGRRHYNEGIYHFHWILGRVRAGLRA